MNSISQVFAIGDIHGCNSLLKKIHKKILNKSEKVKGNKILVYLGDYIDRGAKVKETIDAIINFKPRHIKCIFLRGNHEQMLFYCNWKTIDNELIVKSDQCVYKDWFNTGDLVRLNSHNELYYNKRKKNRK